MTLFVGAHGDTSSRRTFTAGVPQGGIWSSILLNLYMRHLPAKVSYCNIFSYANDSTLLKVIPTKDDRIAAAEELNADLGCLSRSFWTHKVNDTYYRLKIEDPPPTP